MKEYDQRYPGLSEFTFRNTEGLSMPKHLSLPINCDGVGYCLSNANRNAGLRLSQRNELQYPWLPDGVSPEMIFDRGFDRNKLLDEDNPGGYLLPTVLVEDVIVYDGYNSRYVQNSIRFRSYYTPEVLIAQMGQGAPDWHGWREATVFEAACCIAQYGKELGSVRFGGHHSGWHQDTAQAYRDSARQDQVTVHCYGSNERHHRMFVRTSYRPHMHLVNC